MGDVYPPLWVLLSTPPQEILLPSSLSACRLRLEQLTAYSMAMQIPSLLGPVPLARHVVGLISTPALLAGYSLFRLVARRWRRGPPLPPGPPGEFLLGHYRVVPLDAAFVK